MTTIFFLLAKEQVILRLNRVNTTASSANQTPILGHFRNKTLSGLKQSITLNCITSVSNCNGNTNDAAYNTLLNKNIGLKNEKKGNQVVNLTDETSERLLEALIDQCQNDCVAAAKKAKKNKGNHFEEMKNLGGMLRSLYKEFASHSWTNIELNVSDPYSLVFYHIARYITILTVRDYCSDKKAKFPELTEKKKDAALEFLKICEEEIGKLDKNHSTYEENRIETVLDCLNKLQEKNRELTNQFTIQPGIPFFSTEIVTMRVKTPKFGAHLGGLNKQIQSAKEALDKLLEEQKKLHEQLNLTKLPA